MNNGLMHNAYFAIMLMAFFVYFIRISGYLFASYIRFSDPIKLWLDYLPGCIMVATIAPELFPISFVKIVACLLVVLTMYKTRNLFLSILIGVGFVMCCHYIYLGK